VEKRCAVIGAGLGGLSAAIHIALKGITVDLFERSAVTGGKAGELRHGRYRFDTGPSLLTMPFVIESVFTAAGEDMKKYLTVRPLESHCEYFYPDGTRITAHADPAVFADEARRRTGESPDALKKYLSYCKNIYDLTAELFLFNDFHEASTFRGNVPVKTLLNLRKIDSMRSMHRANRAFFRDSRIIQLFDRYATYNGSDPFQAPATLNIIPHVEYNMGSFIVMEGIHRIAEALTELALKVGITIQRETPVEAIITEKRRVTGIVIAGKQHFYDIVVSNADVNSTYEALLGDTTSRPASKYRKMTPSSSAMVWHLGVKTRSGNLGIHNILFSKDYRKEFNELFTAKTCPEDPTVYIYISSKFKPDDAPEDGENWFVMINAPCDSGQDWAALKDLSRERVMDKIRAMTGIDIERAVDFERVTAPPDIERTTLSRRGSLYGISSNTRSAAFLRQRIRSKEYKGLYFCGGSAHPGGGIPLVILSGKIAGDLVGRFEQ